MDGQKIEDLQDFVDGKCYVRNIQESFNLYTEESFDLYTAISISITSRLIYILLYLYQLLALLCISIPSTLVHIDY